MEERVEEEAGPRRGGCRAQPAAVLVSQVAIKCVPRDRIHHWAELVSEQGQRVKPGRAGRRGAGAWQGGRRREPCRESGRGVSGGCRASRAG